MLQPPEFQLASKEHMHTTAMRMATDDMDKVIKSFRDGPQFMGKSAREQRREDLMAAAAPDIQLLDGTLSKGLVERLARLDSD